MVQINEWIEELKEKLLREFGERIIYIGLQGSYRRGEADEKSDIDVMTVLDCLEAEDLTRYRQVVNTMEEASNACGFLCGKAELAHWPSHEIFLLLKETKDVYGSLLPLVPSYDKEDIRRYVRIGVGNLYHEICHSRIYGDNENKAVYLAGSYKATFYLLQCVHYLRTGEFYLSKKELLAHLTGTDKAVLQAVIDFRKNAIPASEFETYFALLFRWCKEQLCGI